MKKAVIVIIVLIIVLVSAAAGAGICYFFITNKSPEKSGGPQRIVHVPPKVVLPNPADVLAKVKKEYPETITGVIKFLDTKTALKTTLTTSDGTVYILWPPQAESIYESLGAKNGGEIQVNGKPLDGGKLNWVVMKPI